MTTHKGGCHCGRIRFEVEAPADLSLSECNCSICNMVGYQHLIVPRSHFESFARRRPTYHLRIQYWRSTSLLLQSHCGVKSFYVPRSHPDGISVNGRCLDPETISSVTLEPFDGRNWEQNREKLAPLPE